jgi:hypothetical protein
VEKARSLRCLARLLHGVRAHLRVRQSSEQGDVLKP